MWLFRLPPIVYLVLAPIGLIVAVYLFFTDQQSEADKAAARKAKPPAEVRIEAFDAAKNTGTAHEVNVLGQVDVAGMMEVTKTKKGTVRERWTIAGIHPTTAETPEGPAIGMFVQRGPISDDQLAKMVVGEGKFGPVMRLNGFLISRSTEGEAIAEVSSKIPATANAIYIDPFEDGRDAGLSPDSAGRELSIGALVISLLVGAFGAFRFWSERNRDELPDAEPEPVI